MSKVTEHQRMLRSGQPYTKRMRVPIPRVEATPEGTPSVHTVYVEQVLGFTLEDKFVDDQWTKTWEEHDLGQVATRIGAEEVAAGWRDGLVGEYSIGGR